MKTQAMRTKFEVVISGISGRFPECDDIHTFKNKLYNFDTDFITVNNKKWPTDYKYKFDFHTVPNATGKYVDVETFDYRIFKLNNEFGKSYDIINRKVLEPSFEAIVDAGINPYSLDGENIGVFMSCGIDELESKLSVNDSSSQKTLIGMSRTMQANRVSFSFNFKGPSFTYQIDILGSLQALCDGYNAVANGTVDAAIIGVASNIVDPKLSFQYLNLGLLSQDGLCRAFDKYASGYGRSESTVILFLQRAQDAKRSYGSILFCDSFYFGCHSSSILGYTEDILKQALENIYEKNNFTNKTSELAFMEMNASGIKKFETMELNATADIVCKYRKCPLSIGSIKSNIGHTESSASMMSLLKILFILDSEMIVPNVNYNKMNDDINDITNKKLKVIDKITPLTGNIVGINSIGISSNISHAVLKQNPKSLKKNERNEIPKLLLICGRTENGLRNMINKIEKLKFNEEFVSLANDVFSSYMPAHLYRGYTILPVLFKAKHAVEERGDKNRPVWFVFSGMGSQWNGMGQELFDLPIFAEIIAKCDKLVKPKGIDIYHLLTSDDSIIFDSIVHAFVAITSMQIALIEILRAIGIKPNGIIGHSVGEIACAYADGCLTLEEAVLSSYERGIAFIETKTVKGMMAAIGKGYEEIKNILPEEIDVACHNSTTSCTLSGPTENVNNFIQQLINEGVFAKTVNVANFACHSRYIMSVASVLLPRLKKLIQNPKKRSSKWICTSAPESEWDTPLIKACSAEYLTNNLINPVYFEEGCKYIPDDAVIIEVAPHGLLQAILKRSLPDTCTNISLTYRSKTKDNMNFLLSSIGRMYIAGCEPTVNALFSKVNYPVSRGTPSLAPFCDWFHEDINPQKSFFKPLPETPLSAELITVKINENTDFHYLQFHKFNNRIIIPPSFFMYLTWWMLSIKRKEKMGSFSVLFENIKVHKHVKISIEKPRFVTIMIQTTGYFEVILEDEKKPNHVTIIMSGRIEAVPQNTIEINLNEKFPNVSQITLNNDQFYSAFKNVGYDLMNCFTPVQELSYDGADSYAKIMWNGNWVAFFDALMKIQMYSELQEKSLSFYPYSIRKLTICSEQFSTFSAGDEILCHRNRITNELKCNGLTMFGFNCEVHSSKETSTYSSKIKFQGLQFVSYSNPQCKDVKNFLELCLQVVVENLPIITDSHKSKLCIVSSTKEYLDIMQLFIKRNDYSKLMTTFCSKEEIQSKKPYDCDTCFLLLNSSQDDINELDFKQIFVLVTCTSQKIDHKFEENFVLIIKQTFGNNTFCLYKTKSCFKDNISSIVWENNNLEKDCDVVSKEEQFTYVVRNSIQANDLFLILSKTKTLNRNKRYLFLMKKDKNSFENIEWLIRSQLVPDLLVSILRENEWGTYKNVHTAVNNDKNNEFTHVRIPPCDLKIETIETHFICTDFDSETLFDMDDPSEPSNYGLEYSGIHQSGKKMMGLAYRDYNQQIVNPDSILMWQIPEEWSLEDAVTVPFIYTQAYYVLSIAYSTAFKSSVLINAGKNYLFTEKCISIYLSKNYTVYVTISNSTEALYIKQKFPQLEKSQILYETNCSYEIQLLLLTEGKGVDIVINCLSGFQHIIASLNCVRKFGHFFDFGKANCTDVYSLRLRPFLKSIVYSIIPNKISFFTNMSEEIKKNLQEEIEKGIKLGLVIPSEKIILNQTLSQNNSLHNQKLKKIVHCFDEEKQTVKKKFKVKYDVNHSFIIVAGDDSWIQLIEWLFNKGARKFTVILDDTFPSSNSLHLWKKITIQNDILISFKSFNEINSAGKAAKIIFETNKLATLETIYFIFLKDSSKLIYNLDAGSQLLKLNIPFISLFSGGLEEMELRRCKGLPSVVIHSDKFMDKLDYILSKLDYVLNNSDPIHSPVLYKVIDLSHKLEKKTDFSSLNIYLPKNIMDLENAGNEITKTVIFKERTSLSAPYSETKGVYPIFVLPCISGKQLDPLLKNLFYPVFCATLSESNSILELASQMFQALNEIQSCGPVTVISEAWNASVAIELTSLFESRGRKFRLFLLEGNPYEWKNIIKNLGEVASKEFDDNLIKQLFSFNSQKTNYFEPGWEMFPFEEKIKYYLFKSNAENVNLEKIIRTARVIQNQFRMVLHYYLKDNILENSTLFLKHFSETSSLKLSATSNFIKIKDDTYEDFLKNKSTSQKINDNAAFNWWDCSK